MTRWAKMAVGLLTARARGSIAVALTVSVGLATTVLSAAEAVDFQANVDVFPGSEARGDTRASFESYTLVFGPVRRRDNVSVPARVETVEGKIWRRNFFVKGDVATGLEIYRNYQTALRAAGMDVLSACEREACGAGGGTWSGPLDNLLATNVNARDQFYLLARAADPDVFVALFVKGQPGSIGVEYMLDVIEPAPLRTGRVAVTVDALKDALARDGKVAVYDIFFDTGSATLKSESDAVLQTIVALLAEQSKLALYVVGHTDDSGLLARNASLSSQRATAVVDALVARGVARMRLTPFGAGPYAPAATNRDPDGRTKNRRVELVERLTSEG